MTGKRAFWTLVTVSVTIHAAVAFLGCCLVTALAWQFTHHGIGADPRSGAAWAGATLLTLSTAGAIRSARRLWLGLSATRAMDRQVRAMAVTDTAVHTTAQQAGLTTRVDVIESAGSFAFTHGLLRPRVAVSSGLMKSAAPEELRAVLAHEAEHVRGRDPLRTLMADFLAARHIALPLLRHLRTVVATDRELAADRCAMAHCGVSAVAGALLKAGDTPRWADTAPAAAMGDRTLLAVRITQLEGTTPPPVRPEHRQVAVTAGGAALYMWAIAGSAWLMSTTPLACLGGH